MEKTYVYSSFAKRPFDKNHYFPFIFMTVLNRVLWTLSRKVQNESVKWSLPVRWSARYDANV